jgi:osmotically inducible protein OsmC
LQQLELYKGKITKKGNATMNTTQTSEEIKTTQPEKKVVYTAKAHTTGGRDGGASRTSDGRLDVKFSVPGKPGAGTNPEQMLAAGWSACFISALGVVAAKKKVSLPADLAIDAEVDLCTGIDGYSIKARLNASLPGLEREAARALLDAAHQICPYSKATRGNIDVVINLV